MPSPKAPRPSPATQEGRDILRALETHKAIPHLGYLDPAGAAVGDVPTLQANGTYALVTPPGAAGGAPVGSATPKGPSGVGVIGVSTSSMRQDAQAPRTAPGAAARWNAIATTVDPSRGSSTVTPGDGQLLVCKTTIETTSVITNVLVAGPAGATTPTSAFVVVYALDGTMLGSSGDVAANMGTGSGTRTIPLTTPTASIPAGTEVLVGLLITGSSRPAIAATSAASAININTSGLSRILQQLTGLTALPSTLTGTSAASPLQVPVLLLT